jgi:hypothetical protein
MGVEIKHQKLKIKMTDKNAKFITEVFGHCPSRMEENN